MSSVFDIASLIGDDSEDDLKDARAPYHERKARWYRQNGSVRSKASRSGIKPTLLDLPICGIDGEGKTRPNGRHDYTQFVAVSERGERYCIEAEHLVTERCLEFIMNLPDDHVYLGYGLSYDTNMWLRDVPNIIVDMLLDKGKWRYRQFELEWVERKYMTIRAYGKSRTVYDVLAFFQVPFVAPNPETMRGACDAWLPEYTAEIELIRVMKDLRGKFQDVPDERIVEYTFTECEMLVRLMRKFIDALRACKVKPRALYGPGAVASAYLEKMGVKRYMVPLAEPLATLSRCAYFGGRFDAAVFGWLEDCYQNDIKSAYPSKARYLPCLKCCEWEHTTRLSAHGLYHVEWRVPDKARWGPFPHRTATGLIFYPYEGAGWYHADEVAAAREFYGSDAIRITEGWALVSRCDHKPFVFIDSLYALRKQLETDGNYDQGVVIKLILNSLYGKLAQQVGMRKDRPPPFQCFFWAGEITSGTRAQILRTLAMDPDKVISIATDGIVVTEMLDLEYGEELGDWDVKRLSSFAQLSNGVYHAIDDKGKHIDRARGLGRGVLNFDKKGSMYKQWKRTHGMGEYAYRGRTRFITLREARQRSDRNDVKCRWLDDEWRTLKFAPQRRFPWPDGNVRKRDLLSTRLLSYVDYQADRESQPFRIKTDSAEVKDARDLHHNTKWYDSA
jgi:hypothetical protein